MAKWVHLSMKRIRDNGVSGGVNSERYQMAMTSATVSGWLFIHFVSLRMIFLTIYLQK